jgi:putative flippase GtrA
MKFVFHVQIDNTVPVLISAGIGFTAAVTSNFIWNRYWTYPDSRSRSVRRQLSQFFVVNAVGLGIRAVVLKLLYVPGAWLAAQIFTDVLHHPLTDNQAARLGANFAIMVALVIVMFWNFFVNRRWTYSDVH